MEDSAAIRFKKPLSFYLGNFLMIISLLAILIIYFPLINLYLNPLKTQPLIDTNGYFLSIPKLSAQAQIFEGINPWEEKEYRPVLEKGIAQSKNSFPPGQGKTTYLFAHSSDAPWRITYYNTIFFRLGDLKTGDQILLHKNGQDFHFSVTEKKEVWPTEVNYLIDTSKNQLILQTCTPIGTSFKRLLVFADPQ